MQVNFCSHCGQPVRLVIPEGDNVQRHVCIGCGTVHYQNPKIVAGCVPEYDGRILLCRRAIEPRLGYWTIPAGFMENGETTQDAARREAAEEALADVEIGSLLAVVHVLHADQVHVMFRARLPSPAVWRGPGKPRSHAVRRGRDPVAGHRVSQRRIRAQALPGRPSRRRRAAPFHDHRLSHARRRAEARISQRGGALAQYAPSGRQRARPGHSVRGASR